MRKKKKGVLLILFLRFKSREVWHASQPFFREGRNRVLFHLSCNGIFKHGPGDEIVIEAIVVI